MSSEIDHPAPHIADPVRSQGLRRLEWPYALVMAIAIAGYPIVGMLASAVGLESTVFTVPFRVAMLAAYVGLILAGLLASARPAVSPWLVAFLVAYSVRLYYDVFLDYLIDAEVAGTTFVGILVPAVVAAAFAAEAYNPRKFLYALLAISGVATVGLSLFGFLNVEVGVASLEQTGNRLDLVAVNAITIGQTGATLILAAVGLLVAGGGRRARLVAAAAIVMGSVLILQSGSRGPLIAVIAAVVLMQMIRANVRGIVILAFVALVAASQVNIADVTVLERLTSSLRDESGIQRLELQQSAIAQFFAKPIVGSAYAELTTMAYPHNIVIETAMAMGIAGLALLTLLLVSVGRAIMAGFRSSDVAVPLLATSFLILAQFSGALWGASILFATLAMLTGGYRQRHVAQTVSGADQDDGQLVRPSA